MKEIKQPEQWALCTASEHWEAIMIEGKCFKCNTSREDLRVLEMLAQGKSYKEIRGEKPQQVDDRHYQWEEYASVERDNSQKTYDQQHG